MNSFNLPKSSVAALSRYGSFVEFSVAMSSIAVKRSHSSSACFGYPNRSIWSLFVSWYTEFHICFHLFAADFIFFSGTEPKKSVLARNAREFNAAVTT